LKGSGSTVLLDLLQVEEQSLPNLTIAVLPRSGKITLCNLETRVGVLRFEEMLRWGLEAGKVLQGAMEEVSQVLLEGQPLIYEVELTWKLSEKQAVKTWADSLARPSKTLTALFPGIDKGAGGEEEEEMDL
jgi:exosome complex component RRP41